MNGRKRWLGLLPCLVLFSQAAVGYSIDQSISLTNTASRHLLADQYPRSNVLFSLELNYSKPGVVMDTVGIAVAPPGSFALILEPTGHLAFQIYDYAQKSPNRLGSGWHVLRSTNTLAPGKIHAVEILVLPSHIEMRIDDRLNGRFPLKAVLSGKPVYLGDFPGDDKFDPRFNIHPSMIGKITVLRAGVSATGRRPPGGAGKTAGSPVVSAPEPVPPRPSPPPPATKPATKPPPPPSSLAATADDLSAKAGESGLLDEAIAQAGAFPYALGTPVAVTNFPGFAFDDPCNPGNWTLPIVAWSTAHHERVFSQSAAKSSSPTNRPPAPPLSPEEIENYQKTTYQTMESMRLMCGATTGALATAFNAVWAPFLDQPNADAFAYFTRLNSLMARYWTLQGQIEGDIEASRQAWQQAGVAAGMLDEDGARSALDNGFMIAQRLLQRRGDIAKVMGDVVALGDPPNPLQAKCRARRNHQAALDALQPGDSLPGSWVMVDAVNTDWVSGRIPFKSESASLVYAKPLPHYAYDYQMLWSHPPGRLNPGAVVEVPFQAVRTGQDSSRMVGLLDVPRLFHPALKGAPAPLTQVTYPQEDFFSFVLEGSVSTWKETDAAFLEIRLTPYAGLIRNKLPPLDKTLADWRGERVYRYEWDATGKRKPYDPGPSPAGTVSGLPEAPAAPAAAAGNASPPRHTTPEIAAAVLEHRQTIGIIRRNLQRASEELGKETDPARRERLEDEVLMHQANIQAENDLIDSLETGTIVHTRTAWEEREQQRFLDKIRTEVYLLGAETRWVAGLPRMADNASADPYGTRQQVFLDIQAVYSSGLSLEERVNRLRKIGAGVQDKVEGEKTKSYEKLKVAEDRLWYAEKIQTAANLGIMAGAMLVPGGGYVAMGYGFGTGYAEGGPAKAAENTVRALSPAVDVAWAGYEGYYAQELDPATGKPRYRGWKGAAENAALTYVLNKVTDKIGERLQGAHPSADLPGMAQTGAGKGSAGAGKGKVAPEPRIDAFEENVTRFRNELAQVNGKYEGFYPKTADGKIDTSHPNYPAVKAMHDTAAAKVRDSNGVIAKREDLKADLLAATRKHESRIPAAARHPDGTPDTKHPDYQRVKAEWDADMAAIRKQHNAGYESRWNEQQSILKENGLETSVTPSGGKPKSIMSDIDLTAKDMASGVAFINGMKKKGHNVLEFSDRWVIPGTDTTIWKPNARPEKIGSSAHSSSVDYFTSRSSDKFPTEGGVAYTTGNSAGVEDPAGAVIANLKKATEAGIGGGTADPDYHIIGKSCDKAAEVANKYDPHNPIQDPDFFQKAKGVREHKTPEEAGVLTFGNPPSAKENESRQFLSRAQRHMQSAMKSGETASQQINADNLRLVTACDEAGDRKTAKRIREMLVRARVSNEAAMQSLSRQDPAFIARIHGALCSVPQPPQPPPPPGRAFGKGWLLESSRKVNAEPLPPVPPTAPPLADTMRAASQAIDKQALPALKPGTPQKDHFQTLKTAFDAGDRNPVYAARSVRAATGYEMSKVASDLAGLSGGGRRGGGGPRIADPLAGAPGFADAPPLENRELTAISAVWVYHRMPIRYDDVFPLGFSNTRFNERKVAPRVSIVPPSTVQWRGGSLQASIKGTDPNYQTEASVKIAASPGGDRLTVVQTETSGISKRSESWDLCRVHDLPLVEKKVFGGNPRFSAWVYRAEGTAVQPLLDAYEFGMNASFPEGRGKYLFREIRWDETRDNPRFTVVFCAFHPSQFDDLVRTKVITPAQRTEFEAWIETQKGWQPIPIPVR